MTAPQHSWQTNWSTNDCRQPTVAFSKEESPDEITEQMVLKTKHGRNAVQYVSKGEDGDTSLEDYSSVVRSSL
jgi:predicted  nucleic acid-binding Zn ribbon protein